MKYLLHWQSGKVECVQGETIEVALGDRLAWARAGLDYYEVIA